MSQTVADVIVSVLEEAGARRCYGLPGDTLNNVGDAIRRSGIRFVHVRHEEVGGFAAGADALLTGKLALCAGSCGPGSLHFVNGLFDAHRSLAPVVLIASQVSRDELGFDFPQEVDFRSVYASCGVFCEEIRTPEVAHRMTAYAAQLALTKCGVAILIVPADVAAASAPRSPSFGVRRTRTLAAPLPADLDRIAAAIDRGTRIAIYDGSGCEHARAEVLALAEKLKAPVAYTSRAKDFLEFDNPNAVGLTGVFGVESGYHAVMECDVLLLLGCDFAWRQFYPDKATLIQIDIEGAHIGRRHPVDIGAVGDIASTMSALLPRVHSREDNSFLRETVKLRDKAMAKLDARAAVTADDQAIHPQLVAELAGRHARSDAIWTADGGTPKVWLLRHVAATGQNRTVLSLTHGSMANTMPQALGAQAAYPERQVIALSGDGGLTMLFGDLLTAVQESLPIKIVVFNNGSLAFVEMEQKVEGLLDIYTDLINPNFGRVAESLGLWGRCVDRARDLEAAIIEWLAAPGPAWLDVVVDRFELVMPAHVQPDQVLGTAAYSAKAVLHGRFKDVAGLMLHNAR